MESVTPDGSTGAVSQGRPVPAWPYWTEDAVHALVRDLELRGRSPRTIQHYLTAAAYLPARWPLTAADVAPAVEAIAHLTQLKRHHYIKGWHHLARFVQRQGGRPGALPEVRPPRRPHVLPRVAADDDIAAMFNACRTLRELALVAFMVGSGVRFGEVPSYRHQLLAGHVVTADGKTGSRVAVVDSLVEELLSATGDGELLWPTERRYGSPQRRQPLKPAGLRTMWRRIEARAGVRVNPHSCRHAYGTELANQGVDLKHIQDLMGHKSIASTVIYTHLAFRRLSTVINASSPLRRFRLPKPGGVGSLVQRAA